MTMLLIIAWLWPLQTAPSDDRLAFVRRFWRERLAPYAASRQQPLRTTVSSRAESYGGPWVYRSRGDIVSPVNSIDNSKGSAQTQPLAIRLDNGQQAYVSARQEACVGEDDCMPLDCGCFKHDSYKISVKDKQGTMVAETQLWAAYGNFHIVAADLVGGAGDEVLVIKQPNRGSPMYRYDMKIWLLRGGKFVNIGHINEVCEWLWCCCSMWRDDITIRGSVKPYRLAFRRRVLKYEGCNEEGVDKEVGKRRAVIYRRGKYRG